MTAVALLKIDYGYCPFCAPIGHPAGCVAEGTDPHDVDCPTCHAGPRQPCCNKSQRPVPWLHDQRYEAAHAVHLAEVAECVGWRYGPGVPLLAWPVAEGWRFVSDGPVSAARWSNVEDRPAKETDLC